MRKLIFQQSFGYHIKSGITSIGACVPGMELTAKKTEELVTFMKEHTNIREEIIFLIEETSKLPGVVYGKEDMKSRPWWENFEGKTPDVFKNDPFREREQFARFYRSEYDSSFEETELDVPEISAISTCLALCGDNCQISTEDIDFVIGHALLPTYVAPPDSHKLVDLMNMNRNCTSVGVGNGNESLSLSVMLAHSLVRSGVCEHVLCTATMNYGSFSQDAWAKFPPVCVFGDASTAIVVSKLKEDEEEFGSSCFHSYTDGKYFNALPIYYNLSNEIVFSRDHLMLANEMAEMGYNQHMPEIVDQIFNDAECQINRNDVKYVFGHQGFQSLTKKFAQVLGMKEEQVYSTFSEYGNVEASTFSLSLFDSIAKGKVKEGEDVLVVTPGSGQTVVGFLERITPSLSKSIRNE